MFISKYEIWREFNKLASVVLMKNTISCEEYRKLASLPGDDWGCNVPEHYSLKPHALVVYADRALERKLEMANPEMLYSL